MNRHSLLALVVTLSFLTPVMGQEPTKGDVVRVSTNLVQIDVVVTDKNGRQVTDLTAADFEVSEDGKKQQVTNFSYMAAGAPTAGTIESAAATPTAPSKKGAQPVMPATLKREQVRRTVALVIDDLGLSFESFGYARQALTKFVDEQMQPNDLVAVLRTARSAGILQQFTSDKRQLHAAINSLRWNQVGRGGISPVGTLNEQSITADIRDNIQFREEAEETRAGQYSVGTIGTLSAIVRGLGEMPGRKSIVLVSEAFRMFGAQGRNVQLVQALRSLTDEANANSVAIYTVDASGLQSYIIEASDRVAGYSYVIDPQVMADAGGAMGPTGQRVGTDTNAAPRTLPRADTLTAQAEEDSGAAFQRLRALSAVREQASNETHTVLSYLAQRTGGLFERNRNDLGASIGRIMQDQQGYYLIGYYRPDDITGSDGNQRRLHDLTVKVKRSGLKVRSRAGYIGVSDEDRRGRPRTRAEQLTAALISPFASGDVRVRLTSLFGDDPASGSYLRSLLHIDARDLSFKEETGGGRTAELEMVVVAFGDSGQVVDQLSYPQTVRAANEAEYQRMLQDGLVYILNFPLKQGGPYQMRVAVRDSTSERNGAAMQFIEAPDLTKNRLALSGIVLSDATVAEKATAAEQDVQSGPAVRRLRQGMMLDYRYIIYHAQGGGSDANPMVQTQMLLLREEKPVFTGKLVSLDVIKQPNPKRIPAGGRLRIGPDLVPGDYVLQVVVRNTTDPKKPRTATQWIDFEIVK